MGQIVQHHSERCAALFAAKAKEMIGCKSGFGFGTALHQETAQFYPQDKRWALIVQNRQAKFYP
jgi:hypothetical protein